MTRTTIAAALLALLAGQAHGCHDGCKVPGMRKGMKVISPIFSDMSGKIGGAVAAKARGGVQYLRSLVIPGNPNTQLQTAVRNALTGAAAYWRATLDDTQRDGWENMATGGKSGMDLFVAANSLRIRVALPVVVDAPTTLAAVLTPPATVVVDNSANTVAITGLSADDDWNANDGGLLIFTSRYQSSSRLSQQFPFRFTGFTMGDGILTTTSKTLPAGTTPPVGSVVYVRILGITPDGRITGDQTFRCTVVA